jgi:hypothetical protein
LLRSCAKLPTQLAAGAKEGDMSGDKLRNAGGDPLMGFAQWVGRKVRNHDPMAKIDATIVRAAKSQRGVSIVADDVKAPVVLYELADGRLFEIQVRQVEPASYAKAKRVAVGY